MEGGRPQLQGAFGPHEKNSENNKKRTVKVGEERVKGAEADQPAGADDVGPRRGKVTFL